MVGALRRSCNPWFYHMGFNLHRWADYYLPDMARSFGFGPPTGVVGLTQAANEEVGGAVPSADLAARSNTDWTIGDSVNMAIGQGDLTVTPLQLVMAYSALANGGQLLRPQLVLQMAAPGAEPAYKLETQTVGVVPISAETLATVRQGMWEVVNAPTGTATYRFKGLRVPIYGKTGTAEDRPRRPHAWFAGYTDAKQAGKPDIAAVVVLENKGEGSEWAAPVFRRIVESYFYGEPKTLYHWEAEYGLTAVPSPFPTFVPFTYVVQAGDSLASIAYRNKVTMDELMLVNQLANPNALTEGQTIIIARGGVSDITLTPEFTLTPTP
jgi:penicillin-binding protein 2